MLGEAPGTARLGEWVASVDGGMTLEELANHIAASDVFQATYPNFSTNQEFAEAFLGDLMGGENVSAALMSAAVEIVVGLLNDGMTRGALALAAVGAMLDIAMDETHPARGDLGGVAVGLYHRIDVAKHYTLEARMADPSSDVLAGVTSDPATAMAAKDAIGAVAVEGQRFVLTPGVDAGPDFTGGDADDTFVAVPADVSGEYVDVLNAFDSLDGGAGMDTLHISGAGTQRDIVLGTEDVKNIESVVIDAVREGITADLSEYEGLEMVNLSRFGPESDVSVSVTVDGATVSTDETFGGTVMIAGASGEVNVTASKADSNVHVGSAGHTESVTVKDARSVTIGKNDDGGGQSQTVTSVSANNVWHNAVTTTQEPSGTYKARVDRDGFVVGDDGSTRVQVRLSDTVNFELVKVNDDGVLLNGALAAVNGIDPGDPITVTITSWDHDGDEATTDDATAIPPETGPLATVVVELKFDGGADGGGIVFGDIVSIGSDTDPTETDTSAAWPSSVAANTLNGKALSTEGLGAVTNRSIGRVDAGDTNDVTEGGGAIITVNSDVIETVQLHNTTATALVRNKSKTADGENMPEDLSVTVNKYGSFNADGTGKTAGKLCIAGAGSAENITLTVAGDSYVDLNSNVVKALDISADAKLSLGVRKFNDDGMPTGVSETLASVMVSGEGNVTMSSLQGMKKLASIDASESSGDNSFMSNAELAALTMAMGGAGNDRFDLVTTLDGKLESINTGDGNDRVKVTGVYREDGLTVNLGDGSDNFDGNAGNSMSRVDGGDGRDTLRLSADGATYKDGDKTLSIYSNFEILDVGGGSGTYNVGRLGVDSVEIGSSTDDDVVLSNVGGGTSLSVSAAMAGTDTEADVTYNFADDVNAAGSLIDGGTANILNVSLMAKGGGGSSVTRMEPGSGIADLTITLDDDLLAMSIDSNASVHRDAAGRGVTSGHYKNKVMVDGDSSALEEVKITGNAMTELSGGGLTSLEYVNAAESGAGVDVDASSSAVRVRLVGSHHDDVLKAGDFAGTGRLKNTLTGNRGDDELTGGAGQDTLIGGAGADTLQGFQDTDLTSAGLQEGTPQRDLFVYNAASDSQVSFSRNSDGEYEAKGFDIINGFDSGPATETTADRIMVSKTLFAALAGNIKNTVAAADGGEWNDWKRVDTDGDSDETGGAAPGMTATTFIDGDANRASLGADGAVGGGDDVVADGGATDLRSFIGDGNGFFESTEAIPPAQQTEIGGTTRTVKYSIAVVEQDTGTRNTAEAGDGTWVLFDVDGDGDFDADTDMVIFLAGVLSSDGSGIGFVSADLMSA